MSVFIALCFGPEPSRLSFLTNTKQIRFPSYPLAMSRHNEDFILHIISALLRSSIVQWTTLLVALLLITCMTLGKSFHGPSIYPLTLSQRVGLACVACKQSSAHCLAHQGSILGLASKCYHNTNNKITPLQSQDFLIVRNFHITLSLNLLTSGLTCQFYSTRAISSGFTCSAVQQMLLTEVL